MCDSQLNDFAAYQKLTHYKSTMCVCVCKCV